jgi:hypothetical protein
MAVLCQDFRQAAKARVRTSFLKKKKQKDFFYAGPRALGQWVKFNHRVAGVARNQASALYQNPGL